MTDLLYHRSRLLGVSGIGNNQRAQFFATELAGSAAPTSAYVTVYPLTTHLRIDAAQVLA